MLLLVRWCFHGCKVKASRGVWLCYKIVVQHIYMLSYSQDSNYDILTSERCKSDVREQRSKEIFK